LTPVALIFAWVKILTVPFNIPLWQNYSALIAFLLVVALYIKSRKIGTIALGIYLILSITSIFSLTYGVTYNGFRVGPLTIPIGEYRAWGIFIVYIPLNGAALGNYYLDYLESKGSCKFFL
jgi:hypothetical protein